MEVPEGTLREVVEALGAARPHALLAGRAPGRRVARRPPARGRLPRRGAGGRALLGHASRPPRRGWRRPGWPAACSGSAGRKRLGALLSALSVAGVVDEAQNGPRIVRRLVRRERRTVNVVARAGDPDAERTLVVLAHHDAAQTGALFDQTLQRKAYDVLPWLIEGRKTPPPQWWLAPGSLRADRWPARSPGGGGSSSAGSASSRWARADDRHRPQRDRAGRQRQPVGVRADRRAGRDAPRRAGRGARRVAGLLRGRGDPPGRRTRFHGQPRPRAAAGPDLLPGARHDRLAAAGDARGGGADVDGGLRRGPSTATGSSRARARRASSWSAGCAPGRPPTRSSPAAPATPPPRSRR